MIGIEYPCAGEADVLPNRWGGQVATIARHELDNQSPGRMGRVHSVGQGATGVQRDVQVAVALMAERGNRA
jgi:hypothetical protein